MTDYKGEQESEIESLSFLYEEGTEIFYINNRSFKIFVKNERNDISLSLLFEYPKTYPADPPNVKIVEDAHLNDFLKKNVEQKINEIIEENLGFTMVYSIVEGVRTLLTELKEGKSMHDEMILNQKELDNIKEKRKFSKISSDYLDGDEDEEGEEGDEGEEDEEDDEEEDDDEEDNEEDDKTNYESVLGLKDLCDEKYRVSEEEFNTWRQQFYKDVIRNLNDKGNPDNPTGREIFEKGKFNELNDNLGDADIEDDVQWKDEKLFVDIDLDS